MHGGPQWDDPMTQQDLDNLKADTIRLEKKVERLTEELRRSKLYGEGLRQDVHRLERQRDELIAELEELKEVSDGS